MAGETESPKPRSEVAPGRGAERARRDEADLRHLGYAQELFRSMGGFSNFALSFSIISILTGAVTLFDYGLQMGGPAEMAYGWPLVSVFTLAVAASMAELASAYPASGGMYDWATRLGGPGWGWFTAWFSIVGLIATLAGVDYGCARFVTPLLGLNATSRTLLIVYGAILASHGLINHFGIRLVAWLNDFSVTVHILGVLVIVGALLLFAPKHSVGFFTQAKTGSSFPYGLAFLLGLLQAQWTFTGYDASAHVAEETVDPRRRAPRGIVNSVVISAVVGYLLLFALTLSMHSISSVLSARDASGHPIPAVITILEQGLGARAGVAASLLAAMAMWFCGLSTVASTSRTIFAFARDRGMPLSSLWSTVGAKWRTPSPAIWISAGAAFAISIYSGAYSVVTSISTVGLYVAYAIPVVLGYRARRQGSWTERGPWNLGSFSPAVNLIAILWTVFICIILMMPPNLLAGKTLAGFFAALLIWYGLSERHKIALRAAVKSSVNG
ncbi:MAG: amino acid permease [Terriglobia bacterium]